MTKDDWEQYSKAVKPLVSKSQFLKPATEPRLIKVRPRPRVSSAQPPLQAQVQVMAGVDANLSSQLKKKRFAIDATLDLHGMTQEKAFLKLQSFLEIAQARSYRLVLVITGKGGEDVDGRPRGILRTQVPLWLQQPEFLRLVISLSSALPQHGGAGAFYVRVRRVR